MSRLLARVQRRVLDVLIGLVVVLLERRLRRAFAQRPDDTGVPVLDSEPTTATARGGS